MFRWAEATILDIEVVENAYLSHYIAFGKGKAQPLLDKENTRVYMARCIETE